MKTIALDLDGTIIDSLDGIYSSIKYASNKNKLRVLTKEIIKVNIGPPLNYYLPNLLDISEKDNQWHRFIKDFREHHDNIGYIKYKLYPMVEEFIKKLFNEGNIFYAVTNKPYNISKKSLEYLNIFKYFKLIYSCEKIIQKKINKNNRYQSSKSLCLKNIESKGYHEKFYYIGDTMSDYDATISNNFIFIYANYGYGKIESFEKPNILINSIGELYKIIN